MWKNIATYFRLNPARMSAYISCIVMYLNKHDTNIPIDIVIPSVLIIIGSGEFAQRAEDKKTINALYSDNPVDMSDHEIIHEICYTNNEYKEKK